MYNKFNKEDLDDIIAFLCEKIKNSHNPKTLDRTFKLIKLLKTIEFINDRFDDDIFRTGWLIEHFYKD